MQADATAAVRPADELVSAISSQLNEKYTPTIDDAVTEVQWNSE
jgi:hypothetical protein